MGRKQRARVLLVSFDGADRSSRPLAVVTGVLSSSKEKNCDFTKVSTENDIKNIMEDYKRSKKTVLLQKNFQKSTKFGKILTFNLDLPCLFVLFLSEKCRFK